VRVAEQLLEAAFCRAAADFKTAGQLRVAKQLREAAVWFSEQLRILGQLSSCRWQSQEAAAQKISS
jgi:hypothetical protein